MTPAEFERAQWAYFKHREQIQKDLITTGWWAATLSRRKNVPSLNTLIQPARTLEGDELRRRQEEHERLMKEME